MISISRLTKTYASGLQALKHVDLEIRKGEIFALLGPERRRQDDADQHRLRHRHADLGDRAGRRPRHPCATTAPTRSKIGLVPQELHTDMFETAWGTVSFSRGLFGRPPNAAHLEKVLRDLSLWDKRNDKIMTLSGGMKRRVLIAKALAHEPRDPVPRRADGRAWTWSCAATCGRWCAGCATSGVTIILTTHYIDEAEEMADRIGVINKGELIVVEEKAALMKKLGKKQLTLHLQEPLAAIPAGLCRLATSR